MRACLTTVKAAEACSKGSFAHGECCPLYRTHGSARHGYLSVLDASTGPGRSLCSNLNRGFSAQIQPPLSLHSLSASLGDAGKARVFSFRPKFYSSCKAQEKADLLPLTGIEAMVGEGTACVHPRRRCIRFDWLSAITEGCTECVVYAR